MFIYAQYYSSGFFLFIDLFKKIFKKKLKINK